MHAYPLLHLLLSIFFFFFFFYSIVIFTRTTGIRNRWGWYTLFFKTVIVTQNCNSAFRLFQRHRASMVKRFHCTYYSGLGWIKLKRVPSNYPFSFYKEDSSEVVTVQSIACMLLDTAAPLPHQQLTPNSSRHTHCIVCVNSISA